MFGKELLQSLVQDLTLIIPSVVLNGKLLAIWSLRRPKLLSPLVFFFFVILIVWAIPPARSYQVVLSFSLVGVDCSPSFNLLKA